MADKVEKQVASYVLGVISIVFAFLSPLEGIVLGIVGMVIAGKDKGSKKGLRLSQIGLVLSVIVLALGFAFVYILQRYFPEVFANFVI